MSKQFKEFKESFQHMSKEDLIRQLYISTSMPNEGVAWKKFDQENPPELNTFCAIYSSDSNYVSFGALMQVPGGPTWFEAADNSLVWERVTHYAYINLPGEEEA